MNTYEGEKNQGLRELALEEMEGVSGGDVIPYGMIVTNYRIMVRLLVDDILCSGGDAKVCASARKMPFTW